MIKTRISLFIHKLTFSLHYLSKYSVTSRKTYAPFTRQELGHRVLYKRYTEQFKLHFTDVHKS